MNDQHPIFLSVGITSHNHEKQIARAIESVLSQNTDYSYELIICDDCSTDGTQEKILHYAEVNPLVIKTSFNTRNEGPLANGARFFSMARGKYLTWLDADDCWIFPEKLQIQIDFLENNPDYAGCFHDAAIISENPEKNSQDEYSMRFHSDWKTYSQANIYRSDIYPWDVLMRKIIPTASLVFQKTDFTEFFRQFDGLSLSLSWAVHLWLIRNSKFKYFNEVWSEYYDHPQGFSKKFSLFDYKLNNISMLEILLKEPYYQSIKKDVFKALAQEYFHLLSLPDINKISPKEFTGHCKSYQKYAKLLMKHESQYFTNNYNQKN